MSWPEAIVTIIKWICGTAVAIAMLIGLMDFHIEFQPPKENEQPASAPPKAQESGE